MNPRFEILESIRRPAVSDAAARRCDRLVGNVRLDHRQRAVGSEVSAMWHRAAGSPLSLAPAQITSESLRMCGSVSRVIDPGGPS